MSKEKSQRDFSRGVLVGMLVLVAADGGNWLITPLSHPDASPARELAVIVQIVVALAAATWIYLRWRRDQSAH